MDSNGVLSVSKHLKDLSVALRGIALRYLGRSDKGSIFANGLEFLVQSAAASSLSSQRQRRGYSGRASSVLSFSSAMENHSGINGSWSSPEMVHSSEAYSFGDGNHDLFSPACNIDGSAMFGDTDSHGNVYGQTDF